MRRIPLCGLLMAGFFIATQAQAATLYIDPPRSELFRGDAIELSIRLDTDESIDECINAVDAVITYSESIVPIDVSIGNSIFSMWVERPTINQAERTITFAGGIPNGYCGRVVGDPRLTNTLATIIMRSPGFTIGGASTEVESGDIATVQFTEATTAYLNDGLGTRADLTTYAAQLQLNRNAGPGIVDPWRDAVGQDTIPPEPFTIYLDKDTRAFSGRYYISFNTTDKQTGIDSYQVMEEPLSEFNSFNWGRADAPWITTRSPYVLKDQSLNSIIRVRALDKAGNEYIATLLPEESMRTMSQSQVFNYLIVGGLLLFALFVLGFGVIAYRRRRKSIVSTDDEVTSETLDGNTNQDDTVK